MKSRYFQKFLTTSLHVIEVRAPLSKILATSILVQLHTLGPFSQNFTVVLNQFIGLLFAGVLMFVTHCCFMPFLRLIHNQKYAVWN